MSFLLSRSVAALIMLGTSQLAVASSEYLTEDAACDVLIAVAKNRHFVGNVPGTYFCESIDDFLGGKYFLANLKFNRSDAEREFVGSNLVGWYAIRKSNRAVFEVDIAEGKLGKRILAQQRPPMPNHTFQPTPSARLN